ncbi:MAG: phytoene desaturase [Pseudomonadales bacterium]|nr:phytoene desaturase [Candidatus Woesebacteria bacterium]MCB9800903.1 phytoene desaturase [Pseudomonadales bacterium]
MKSIPDSEQKKCVVIGGGLAGLATAAGLAYRGYSVILIEKNKDLGGRARVFKQKGFTFDMGPSWYMMPEVIESFFASVGKKSSDYYSLRELSTKYRVFSDSHKPIDIVSNIQKNLRLFETLEPGSRAKLVSLITKTNVAYTLSIELLARKYDSFLSLLTPKTMLAGLRLLSQFNPFQSYERFITTQLSHPLIQKILQFHTVFLGGSPKRTPALYSILIASDFKGKIWYPEGGIGQLPKALEALCKEFGVTIKTEEAVTSVHIDDETKRVTSVDTTQGTYDADIFVTTADYAYFDIHLLPNEYKEYSKDYWENREYAISSVLVYLGLSKKIPELQHHNFYFQDDWNDHFSTIQNSTEFPKKPCYYVCAPSVTDHTVAPKNAENLFILVPVSVQTKQHGVDEYVEHVLDHVEATTGAEIQKHIVYKKIFAQKDFAHEFNAYKGNALGLSHSLLQSVFMRPRMKAKQLSNLYFAGQFTQPGIGVPMVLLSAQYVIDEIQKDSA